MSKWKKRFEKLREASMCKNVWADVEIDPKTGILYTVYRHRCQDDCEFLKAVRFDWPELTDHE